MLLREQRQEGVEPVVMYLLDKRGQALAYSGQLLFCRQTIRAMEVTWATSWSLRPALRIMINSSRLESKIERNFTRSNSGWRVSCASSKTRRLNSIQLSSRFM